ncbi:MAG: hypothetical protein H0V89_14000 [Deltaproteobacteria bacterium]|nr:hypothetical protein [Deltaproteobacteria bacterium]
MTSEQLQRSKQLTDALREEARGLDLSQGSPEAVAKRETVLTDVVQVMKAILETVHQGLTEAHDPAFEDLLTTIAERHGVSLEQVGRPVNR